MALRYNTDVHDCCGSVLSYKNVKPISSFARKVQYGVLSVLQENHKKDTYPPSKILDLRVRVNDTTGIIRMKWSAPGDDYDWGRASSYEAIIADSWADARKMIGVSVHDLPSPLSPPNEQSLELTPLDMYGQLHYIAIVAVDASGNKGEVGNIADFLIRHPPSTSPPPSMVYSTQRMPSFYSGHIILTDDSKGTRDKTRELEDGLSAYNIIMITAIPSAGLLLVTVLIVYFSFCKARKYKSSKKNPDSIVQNRNIMIRSNSNLEIDQANSYGDTDAAVKDSEGFQIFTPISKLLPQHQKQNLLPSGQNAEDHNAIGFSSAIQDPFPDVTQTGYHLHTVPHPSSVIQSNPQNYQIPMPEKQYPYQYGQVFTQQSLPPFSTGFTQFSQPSNVPQSSQRDGHFYCASPHYRNSMPSCVSESYKISAPTMIYSNQYVENMSLPPIPTVTTSKITPSVFPNSRDSKALLSHSNSLIFVTDSTDKGNSETNRRNVTLV